MKEYLFKVSEDDEGERIDKYLTLLCPDLTRTYIQKQIEQIHNADADLFYFLGSSRKVGGK